MENEIQVSGVFVDTDEEESEVTSFSKDKCTQKV